MAEFTNNIADCFQAAKEHILDALESVDETGKAWGRMRYADNLGQWLELAAIEGSPEEDGHIVKVAFVTLAGFTSTRTEARQVTFTVNFTIEIIRSFVEGTDLANSTLDFENLLAEYSEIFLSQEGLGAVDITGGTVYNTQLDAANEGAEGAKPVIVDGILAHRKVCGLDVQFRVCR